MVDTKKVKTSLCMLFVEKFQACRTRGHNIVILKCERNVAVLTLLFIRSYKQRSVYVGTISFNIFNDLQRYLELCSERNRVSFSAGTFGRATMNSKICMSLVREGGGVRCSIRRYCNAYFGIRRLNSFLLLLLRKNVSFITKFVC